MSIAPDYPRFTLGEAPSAEQTAFFHEHGFLHFTGFIDAAYPDGIFAGGVFGDDGGTIEVSADGQSWSPVRSR